MAKTVVEELADATERIEALEAEAKKAGEQIASLTAEVDKAKADTQAAVELTNAADAEKAEAVAALEAEKAEHGKTQEQLTESKATLEKVLANPAFAAAAKAGLKDGTGEGTQAKDGYETKEQALAAYRQIEDARERAAFRAENKELLGL